MTARIVAASDDAYDKPIRVVVKIKFIIFNNKLVKPYHDFASKLT